jgi:hypothetical protein
MAVGSVIFQSPPLLTRTILPSGFWMVIWLIASVL